MYLLDTNAFIQAQLTHYSFDVCPGFWSWLIREHRDGKVFSIQKVKEDLLKGSETDDVRLWAESIPKSFFIAHTASTQPSFVRVANLLNYARPGERYEYAAIASFFESSDYFLVAQALELGATVVTHEGRRKGDQVSKKRVKIPYVCEELGILCINTFKMLQQEGARFVEAAFSEL